MTDLLALDITSIAAGGDGVARHDGLVVFVPRTAPGDRVLARVTQKGRLARGIVDRIEEASDDRIEAPCPHYVADACGGCQLQHLTMDAQHDAKRHIVADSFRRIGKREIPLPEVRSGENAWRYRRKLTLALRRHGGRWIAGLHPLGEPERVFPLQDCLISDERLIRVWREVLSASAHLPDADRLRGAVRVSGDGGGRAGFVLEGGQSWTTHDAFFSSVPSLQALWWIPDGGARRVLHDTRTPDSGRGPEASFAQVNPGVAALLETFVIESAMSYAPATIVDAYSGAGTVAAELAGRGVRVTAIELDAEASAFSAAHLPSGSRALTGRVEQLLGGAFPADLVILNPPRAGVDARVTSRLEAETSVRAILYVSCDPATLARDVARLPSWRIARVTVFDMFPQTAHVETVCELVPGAAP